MSFTDRTDAGRRLGQQVHSALAERDEPGAGAGLLVVGLPRGGVPVAYEVAAALGAPLDVLLVHKLGVPFQPELAMGAVGDRGNVIVDERTVRWAGVTPEQLANTQRRQIAELQARGERLRRGRAPLDLTGRDVVIVDDGAATGLTALAACELARSAGAGRVIVAVPVASREAAAALREAADELICLEIPDSFMAVGAWYRDFGQTSEAEVLELLDRAAAGNPPPPHPRAPRSRTELTVPAGPVELEGTLVLPEAGHGLVVFAHGSGSSRHSPRNRAVAGVLEEAGLGTLLFDLLTRAEDGDRRLVFDIPELATRLAAVTRWLRSDVEALAGTPIGYFGASTGAAAALVAAATAPDVAAVVSRGGRPDLAGDHLGQVRAPTLLIVGSHDEQVLELNQAAQARMVCESRLEIVPGATHLFEEPGTLAAAADLARDWFSRHLR